MFPNCSLGAECLNLENLKKLPRITAEISIDSCSKEVYEEIRLGGNWKRLNNNLHFIFTDIPNLDFVRLTFVTQDTNYHEMLGYAEMADYYQKLNGMRTEVNYIHINNWGTYTPEVFKKKAIASPNHPDHHKFLVRNLREVLFFLLFLNRIVPSS